MKAKKARGWGIPDHIGLDVDNVSVHLGCVCTCTWRKKHCTPYKKCEEIFRDEGQSEDIQTLKSLMGKDFPKSWENQRLWVSDYDEAEKRSDAYNKFRREFFKKCRPVEIEIRVKQV